MALKVVPSTSATLTWWPVMSERTVRNRSRFWATSCGVSGPLRSACSEAQQGSEKAEEEEEAAAQGIRSVNH